MQFTVTSASGVCPDVRRITSDIFEDHRGTFCEAYREQRFQEEFDLPPFVQCDISVSKKGVARGLHYQVFKPQGKLIRTVHGRAIIITVDVRQGSTVFGQSCWTTLDAPHKALWVPPGFASGIIALDDDTTVVYECSTYHYVGSDRALNIKAFIPEISDSHPWLAEWIDPNSNFPASLILSDKDRDAPMLDVAPLVPEAEWMP